MHALLADARHLVKADSLPDLNELLDMHVGPVVDRTMQEEAYPWPPFSPGIDAEVRKRTEELVNRYGTNWTSPPATTGIQQVVQP